MTNAGGPRLSRSLLRFAVITTLLTLGVCIGVLWHAFNGYFTIVDPPSASAPRGDTLVVGMGRTPGGPGEWISYAVAFAHLQHDLGRPVTLRYVAEGPEMVALVRDGDVDVALLTVGSYLELERTGDATPLVAPVVAGQSRDAAVVVVGGTSTITTFEGLRGQSVAFTRPSLCGDTYPRWLLARDGQTAEGFFGRIRYSESQDAGLADVHNGSVVATSVRRSSLASWPEGTFRVVATSPEFSMPPIVCRSGLDSELAAHIRQSLLAFDAASELPAGSLLDRFEPVSVDGYSFARELSGFAAGVPAGPGGEAW